MLDANQALETNSSGASQSIRSPRALVIEDDASQRELLATAAREAGFETIEVADGDEALTYLYNQGKADVVLLDMALPRLHGPTVLRVLRNDPIYSGTPIFGVSGYSLDHFQVEVGAGGVNRWFQKPINWDELAMVLANLATTDRRLPASPKALPERSPCF